jgi:hypothetical protein
MYMMGIRGFSWDGTNCLIGVKDLVWDGDSERRKRLLDKWAGKQMGEKGWGMVTLRKNRHILSGVGKILGRSWRYPCLLSWTQ